ncbi:hypothetical protein Btru_016846 [Bulinus truncatus]|nr:hypothetical protein Btru_016846 [Bulinus truncatus]
MSAFLLACGFNGFCQLSSIQSVNLENQISKRHVELEDTTKILLPILIMQLRECDCLQNVAVTWSRLGLTVKRKDNSYLSVMTEFRNTKTTTSSSNVPQVLENHIIVAATNQDILLKTTELGAKNVIFKESSSKINNIQINGLVETILINATHQEFFVSYDANFGILSDRLTNQENVEGYSIFSCISTGIIVREMSCGKEHVVLLDENGCIHSYGGGSKGQLGHNSVEARSSPTVIDASTWTFT